MQHGHLRMKRRAGTIGNQRGVTLIEVLVAAILGIVAVGTINWFSRFQLFSLRNQAVQSDLQMVARGVSDVFARDVRRAGFNPQCSGGINAVSSAKPFQLTLVSDLDGDGALGGVDETLTYRLTAASGDMLLERVANGRTDVLLSGIDVARTRFRYYDPLGAELDNGAAGLTWAERNAVRRIRFELTAEVEAADPSRSMPVSISMGNDVDIRNRHFVNAVTCP